MLAYRFCSWKIKKGGLTAIFAGKNLTCRPKRPVSCVSSLREMQLLDVALKLSYICEHDAWITGFRTTQLSLSFMYPSYLILSYHPRHLQNSRWKSVPRIKESTFKSAMRAAAPSGISKNSSWPIWAFEWNDGRMDGHCNIYLHIIYIHTHLGLSLLKWICGEIIAWVLPPANVAVDSVNVNILIKVPSWNSAFQWFSLCHRVGAGPNCSKPKFPTPWKIWLVKAHV